jgi:hypothetical protein
MLPHCRVRSPTLSASRCHRTPKGGHWWTRQKRPLRGSADLAEQRSTSVIKEFDHEQWLVAVDAHTADTEGMHEQVAVGAATDTDETFAATAALVYGVRASVSHGGLRVTGSSATPALQVATKASSTTLSA